MGFKEVSGVEITEVIRQLEARRRIHEMSRSTGLSHDTIREYIVVNAETITQVVDETRSDGV